MRRATLVLDGELLEQARRELGAKTYSATVNQALAEAIRVSRIRGLRELFGSGLWQGNLAEMRGDAPPRRTHRAKAARRT